MRIVSNNRDQEIKDNQEIRKQGDWENGLVDVMQIYACWSGRVSSTTSVLGKAGTGRQGYQLRKEAAL
jgi:hypothetical protein